MRELFYRIVETKVFPTAKGMRVDSYLLIQGQGKPVHFDISCAAELPEALNTAVRAAYRAVTGKDLPDTAL